MMESEQSRQNLVERRSSEEERQGAVQSKFPVFMASILGLNVVHEECMVLEEVPAENSSLFGQRNVQRGNRGH